MALSDHEQAVLSEMETALRPDTGPSRGSRPSTNHGSRYYLATATGLLIAGAMASPLHLFWVTAFALTLGRT